MILGPLAPDGGSLMRCSHASAFRRLLHACAAARPKATYHVGVPAHLLGWMNRLLPDAAARRLMQRAR